MDTLAPDIITVLQYLLPKQTFTVLATSRNIRAQLY